jgi:hypothetical protein
VVRVVNLRHEATRLLQDNCSPSSEADKLNNEARELSEALQSWLANNVPGVCIFQRHTVTDHNPWPRRHFYSSTVYSYPKPAYAAAWGQCFVVSMIIDSTRYKVLGLSQRNPLVESIYEQERQECVTRLRTMADNLAASVPFSLARFKVDDSSTSQPSITLNTNDEIKPYQARLIVWPLLIAAGIEELYSRQRMWFVHELACLAMITGDGVFECSKAVSMRSSKGEIEGLG